VSEHTISVVTQIAVTDDDTYDVLTTAVEGGYMEEFEILAITRRESDSVVTSVTVHCADHDVEGISTWILGPAEIRVGLERYARWIADNDPGFRSYLGEQWREASVDGWGYFDAIGADAVLQFACFGETVFG